MERVARLRKLVLSMDQKLMATVRSYNRPPPVVHASMRALFLLLGHRLPETKASIYNILELLTKIVQFVYRSGSAVKP